MRETVSCHVEMLVDDRAGKIQALPLHYLSMRIIGQAHTLPSSSLRNTAMVRAAICFATELFVTPAMKSYISSFDKGNLVPFSYGFLR